MLILWPYLHLYFPYSHNSYNIFVIVVHQQLQNIIILLNSTLFFELL